MTKESLIEKLETLAKTKSHLGAVNAIDDCIAIIRQHTAAPDVGCPACKGDMNTCICDSSTRNKAMKESGEISVNSELLRAGIYADIDHGITGTIPSSRTKNDLADSIMGTIEPFLAKHKPVSVSLEKCAEAIQRCSHIQIAPSFRSDMAKAVLDAAEVKYE